MPTDPVEIAEEAMRREEGGKQAEARQKRKETEEAALAKIG